MDVRPATWDDVAAITDLLVLDNRAALGGAATGPEPVAAAWRQPGFVVGRDNLVAEASGRLVGYAAVTDRRTLELGSTDPAAADALLAAARSRGRELGLSELFLDVRSEVDPRLGLVRRHPFRLESETLAMARRLDDEPAPPTWPPGIEVRTYELDDAAEVHDLLDEAYGGWDERYVAIPYREWVDWMTGDSEFDATVWWLAERDGSLVGCALYWSSGWLKDLAVRAGAGAGTRRRARPAGPRRVQTARSGSRRAQGRRPQSDRRGGALLAARVHDRTSGGGLDAGAVSRAAKVSLLRWLRRQLRQPEPLRERLEAAIEHDDPGEARRIVARYQFSEAQRRHVGRLLDEWERDLGVPAHDLETPGAP